jgi:hypothetical protein
MGETDEDLRELGNYMLARTAIVITIISILGLVNAQSVPRYDLHSDLSSKMRPTGIGAIMVEPRATVR